MQAPLGFPVGFPTTKRGSWTGRDKNGEYRNRCVGDVAVKVMKEHSGGRTKQRRKMQVAGLQPFHIPAKVPENKELITPVAQSAVVDIRTGKERNWDLILQPKASQLSIITSTSSSRTLVEPYSATETGSTLSVASSDMYGWEESLSRKTSMDQGSLQYAYTLPVMEKSTAQETVKPAVKADTMPLPAKHASRTKGLLYKVLHPSSATLSSP